MFNQLKNFIRLKTYTLRFSILTIFVTFLSIAMISLIGLMYIRASNNITSFAFDMMKQISSNVFSTIDNAFNSIEYKNKSVAKVIASGVIDLNTSDNEEMIQYANNVLEDESNLFPILRKFVWGDNKGNFIIASKEPNGMIVLETVYHANNKTYHRVIYKNSLNDTFKIVEKPEKNINLANILWYSEAIKQRKTIWVDVYQYYFSRELGISVATPVITKDNVLLGVIKFDASLEFLRKLVENATFSKNGVVFIVTKSNKLIAFPHVIQDKNSTLMDIHQLPDKPWVVASYDYFMKTGKTHFIFKHNNNEYLASYNAFAKIGNSEWLVAIVAPKDDFVSYLKHTRTMSVLIGLLILIASIFIVSSIISHIVKPMKKITNDIDRIKNFDLTHTPKIVSRIKEINAMGSALEGMKRGLRSFQKYIPASLVRDLIDASEEAKTGGVKKSLVILFTDIHNFTHIAETSDPQVLATRICHYFDVLSAIITKNHGTIDKYIGDSIMAFWGAPLEVDQPCHKAARAALGCINQLSQLNDISERENISSFYTTIGINYGEAVVGNFGSRERLSYTAFGDAVNLANRLQDLNRYFGTKIIVSQHVYDIIKDQFILRMIDCVTVKGKDEAINIYELISENRRHVGYDIDAYNIAFSKGFSAYKNRAWDEAIIHFNDCKTIYTHDIVSPLFIERCKKNKLTPPPHDWHGEWNLDKKPI